MATYYNIASSRPQLQRIQSHDNGPPSARLLPSPTSERGALSPALFPPSPSPRQPSSPFFFTPTQSPISRVHPSRTASEESLSLEDRFPFLRDERKRTRKLLTQDQTRLLEAILERTVYPSTQLRETIARQLGITPRKVQIWFQNKRQISRRYMPSQGPIRGPARNSANASSTPTPIMVRSRRATEGSEPNHTSERLLRYRSAEDDLRLANLVDSEGRQFPELQQLPRSSPAAIASSSASASHYRIGTDGQQSEYDAPYIERLRRIRLESSDGDEEDAAHSGAFASLPIAYDHTTSSRQRYATHDPGATASSRAFSDEPIRFLPVPRRQSNIPATNSVTDNHGCRQIASLSDIALRHPERVPALCSSKMPDPRLVPPPSSLVASYAKHRRTDTVTTNSSEGSVDQMAWRADDVRCSSPTSSSSSATASSTTPSILQHGSRLVKKEGSASEKERYINLPSISTLIPS